MRRIQKLLSVSAMFGAATLLAACQKAEPVVSVTDFLNDPALRKETQRTCAVRDDRDTNQTCQNMGRAFAMVTSGAFTHCYKGDVADKACVAAVLASIGR